MGLLEKTKQQRARRKRSIRTRISGTAERPRMTIVKSLKYISVQIIDDSKGVTLASASTQEKTLKGGKNVEAAQRVGKAIAERAKANKITKIVFDRNGYPYHGKVKAVAEAAREGGLEF